MLAADDRRAGAERAPGIAVGVRDHGDDVPHVEAPREHHFLAGSVLHFHGRQGITQGLDDLVLEVSRVVDVQELGDALGVREDVVADARVRVALHLVEEQGRASVEVLLDRRDFEVRIDLHVRGDQLADGLEVLERRAKAPDVLLHPTPPRGDTAPGPRAPSRPRRRGPRPRRAGPGAAASSTISARGPAGSTYSRATAIGSVKRRGPALPGLSSRRCSRRSMLGRCEWPEIRTSTPWLAGSPRSVLRSWMTQSRTPPTSVVATSGREAAKSPR